MIDELLGLIADINPAEIAAHIEQDDLAEWCQRWQGAVTIVLQKFQQEVGDEK